MESVSQAAVAKLNTYIKVLNLSFHKREYKLDLYDPNKKKITLAGSELTKYLTRNQLNVIILNADFPHFKKYYVEHTHIFYL